ncbi:MAG: ribonuclease Z [Desulfobacterales bacterium]
MRPRFYPRLVNGPFGDPALYCFFGHESRALLFDLGDLSPLPPRDLLRISHIFVSHTHMDHFCGFDRVLRTFLGREKKLHLFGPPGFHANVSGKLSGYQWNLAHTYASRLSLIVTEVHPAHLSRQTYSSRNGFSKEKPPELEAFDGCLLAEPSLQVFASHLDHGIPCLAFMLRERIHVNILKTGLDAMGLPTGAWLRDLKQAVYRKSPPSTPIDTPIDSSGGRRTVRPLAELVDRAVRISLGQSIGYVTDAAYSEKNVEAILDLVEGVDHLYIEAAFLDADRRKADEKRHLTAHQAGGLAAAANAKDFSVFHFSPRYEDRGTVLESEAREAFSLVKKKGRPSQRLKGGSP